MFNWIISYQIFFIVCTPVISKLTNETWQFSLGFFCIYCGRFDQSYSYVSLSQSKAVIECTQPYQIFCSSEEAIGCVKYLKIIDNHIEIIKDCLRLTELTNLNTSCQSEYSSSNIFIKEKTFCCNDRPFCNRSSPLFIEISIWYMIFIDFSILLSLS